MEEPPQPEEGAEESLEPANMLGESASEEPQHAAEPDPNPILMGVRRSQRPIPKRDYKRLSAYGYAVTRMHMKAYHMSANKAMLMHGDAAQQAAAKELRQMIDMDVFSGIDWDRMTAAQRHGMIRSFMFFKEKYDAWGNLTKVKARLVANGAQQDELLYEDTTSPTAALSTLFTVLALAAMRGKHVGVGDVPGAYLNADMKSDVHMLLEPTIARILCELEPKFSEFRRRDGSMPVKLKKALYGCKESAQLWYQTLSSYLVELGFLRSDSDRCLFIRGSMHVVVYVDDLLVIANTDQEIQNLFKDLESKFGAITTTVGTQVTYLGMLIELRDGVAEISMDNYVNNLLKDWTQEGREYSTPCNDKVFTVTEGSLPLTEKYRKNFHTVVAKLLYLAKRVKPDLLLPVSVLASRVTVATEEDMGKLKRVMGYLKSHASKKVYLGANDPVVIRCWADAAFGVHHDLRSQNGVFISLGRGLVFASSSKQKTMAKSAFEAEVITATDAGPPLLWIIALVEELGELKATPVLYQDNYSVTCSLKTGDTIGKNSKYIKIRKLWMRELIEKGHLRIIWVDTESMVADFLTKPLFGEKFNGMDLFIRGERARQVNVTAISAKNQDGRIYLVSVASEISDGKKGPKNLLEVRERILLKQLVLGPALESKIEEKEN